MLWYITIGLYLSVVAVDTYLGFTSSPIWFISAVGFAVAAGFTYLAFRNRSTR